METGAESIQCAALARRIQTANGSGGAIAAIEHVSATVARLAAFDALRHARRGHACIHRAAFAGSSAATVLAHRALPAIEQIAATIPGRSTINALSHARRGGAQRHIRLDTRRQVEEHEFENGFLRRHGVVVAFGRERHPAAVIRRVRRQIERTCADISGKSKRIGVPIAVHHAPALVRRRSAHGRVEREMNRLLRAPIKPLLCRSDDGIAVVKHRIERNRARALSRYTHDFKPLLKFVAFRIAHFVDRSRARLSLRVLQCVPCGHTRIGRIFRDIVGTAANAPAANSADSTLRCTAALFRAREPIIRKVGRKHTAARGRVRPQIRPMSLIVFFVALASKNDQIVLIDRRLPVAHAEQSVLVWRGIADFRPVTVRIRGTNTGVDTEGIGRNVRLSRQVKIDVSAPAGIGEFAVLNTHFSEHAFHRIETARQNADARNVPFVVVLRHRQRAVGNGIFSAGIIHVDFELSAPPSDLNDERQLRTHGHSLQRKRSVGRRVRRNERITRGRRSAYVTRNARREWLQSGIHGIVGHIHEHVIQRVFPGRIEDLAFQRRRRSRHTIRNLRANACAAALIGFSAASATLRQIAAATRQSIAAAVADLPAIGGLIHTRERRTRILASRSAKVWPAITTRFARRTHSAIDESPAFGIRHRSAIRIQFHARRRRTSGIRNKDGTAIAPRGRTTISAAAASTVARACTARRAACRRLIPIRRATHPNAPHPQTHRSQTQCPNTPRRLHARTSVCPCYHREQGH